MDATATGEAPSSICPAGWGLPRDNNNDSLFFGSAPTGIKKSFYNLLRGGNNWNNTLELSTALYGYGISGLSAANGGVYNREVGRMGTSVQSSPLSFLRSGNLSWYYGYLGVRNSGGYYWSSYSNSSSTSRLLRFYSTNFGPRNNDYPGYGFSLR